MLNLGIMKRRQASVLVGGIEVDGSGAVYENIGQKIEPGVVMLPGNIEVGTATLEDIKAAYGEPSNMYEDDTYTKLTYEKDIYEDITLTVYKETGTSGSRYEEFRGTGRFRRGNSQRGDALHCDRLSGAHCSWG